MSVGVWVWQVLRFDRGTTPRKWSTPPDRSAGGVPPVGGSIRTGGGSEPERPPARRRRGRRSAPNDAENHDRELFIAAVWFGGNGMG